VISRSTLSARRPLVPVAVGVTLTALLASGVAWSATGSTAVLSVDGQSREVDFRGDTVADVLAAAGLSAGEHDLLVPSSGAEVEDGETVSLRRARELELVVDGKTKKVWTTATSVEEALSAQGLRGTGLALSASRSRSIPLDGLSLAVTTPKKISIIADNAVLERTTAKPTVRDALVEAGIVLDRDDRLSHARTVPVTNGLVVRVTRVRTERVTEQVAVPFGTERREDAELLKGETRTLTAGKTGSARRTVETTYADAKVEKRTVVSTQTLTVPVTRVLAIGTKARPAAGARTSSSSQSTGSADGLNWAALAQCESGGNPRAVNPSGTYRGLYQFSIQTWRGIGGSGDPIDASSGEQTYRAKLLYQRSGAGQWPECGRRLFS
jgi:uncharacterized protein YabE (DUF348 family)